MFNNPLIERYRFSLMRPRQFWVYVTIYITVVLLLLLINASIYKYQHVFQSRDVLYKSIYYQFLAFQVLILWVWAAYNSGSAIRDELSDKSYDFFKMLPLSAHRKAAGILVGKNLVALLLAGISCLFLLLFGCLGNVNSYLQAQIFLLLISVMLFGNSLCLMLSINVNKKSKQPSIAGLIFLGFILVPWLLQALVEASQKAGLESIMAPFFCVKLPILVLISIIALYFSCWAFAGILRKFIRERDPLFTSRGAVYFALGFELVALGLFWAYLWEDRMLVYFYWMLAFLPLMFVPFGVLRNFDNYIERCGFIRDASDSTGTGISALLRYSNLSLGLALFVTWAAFALVTNVAVGMELLPCLYSIAVFFSFYCFLWLLLELYVVYSPVFGKIQLLIGFAAFVYLFLPLILSPILNPETLYLYSFFGFFAELVRLADVNKSIPIHHGIWITNLFLCVIAAGLVWKRYAFILTIRRKM